MKVPHFNQAFYYSEKLRVKMIQFNLTKCCQAFIVMYCVQQGNIVYAVVNRKF